MSVTFLVDLHLCAPFHVGGYALQAVDTCDPVHGRVVGSTHDQGGARTSLMRHRQAGRHQHRAHAFALRIRGHQESQFGLLLVDVDLDRCAQQSILEQAQQLCR